MRIRWLGMMMEHELINPQRSDKLSIFNMRNCKEYLEKMLPLSALYDIKRKQVWKRARTSSNYGIDRLCFSGVPLQADNC